MFLIELELKIPSKFISLLQIILESNPVLEPIQYLLLITDRVKQVRILITDYLE